MALRPRKGSACVDWHPVGRPACRGKKPQIAFALLAKRYLPEEEWRPYPPGNSFRLKRSGQLPRRNG